jgi:hypothetical protein
MWEWESAAARDGRVGGGARRFQPTRDSFHALLHARLGYSPRGTIMRSALASAARRAPSGTTTTIRIPDEALTAFIHAYQQAPLLPPLPSVQGQLSLIAASVKAAHLLPNDMADSIRAVHDAQFSPFVLLQGVPVAPECKRLPVTSPMLDEMKPAYADHFRDAFAVQAALGSFAGEQYTFDMERGENQFQLVTPVEGVPASSQSSVGGSAVNFHTEDPIPPVEKLQPRALTLLMLRPAADPGTYTALTTVESCAADLLDASQGNLLETLAAPRFVHPVPDVFQIMQATHGGQIKHRPASEGAPVLYTREDRNGVPVPCILLQEYTRSLDSSDDEASAALATLRDILTRRASLHALAPGEMLIWANTRCAHGRVGAVAPNFDGLDRLLSRTFHHPERPALVVRA